MIKKTVTILSCLFLSWSSQAQTFTEDFSPAHTWTQVSTGISIGSGKANYVNCSDASARRIYTNHGLTLTDNWVLDIDFQFTGFGSSGPGHHLASLTAGSLDPLTESPAAPWTASNQDAISMMFYSTNQSTTPSTFELVGTSKNDNAAWVNSTGIVLANSNTTYYLRLERLDATHARISAFSDAARTTHVIGSPQCFTLSTGITNNLSVLQHGNTTWGSPYRSLTGWIDNTKLTSYGTTETIAGNQQICAGTGDPAILTSTATSNNPDVTYQWQNSINGGSTWWNIASATSATYDPPAGAIIPIQYRRITRHSSACSDQHISNTVTITTVNCNSLTCDYSTDFSNGTGWTTTGTGVNINNGTFNYDNCIGAASNRMYTNHGVPLTNSWRLDFDFLFTAVGTAGPGHHLASLTNGTLDPVSGSAGPPWAITNQDAISAIFYSTNITNDPNSFMLVGSSKNDADSWVNSTGILLAENVQYYITLERLDQTHARISAYSDLARTVHITGSPQCFTIDPNITSNLNVLQHGNTSWAWNERSLTGRIDNDCLSNLSFSGGTISANEKVACGNLPNQITSTAAASVPNSYYSITSYQWQSSTDGTNWTNITSATGLNYSPPALYTTMYYRRIAFGPCGISLSSNTITKLVLLNAALNSEFTVSANCLSGQSTFTVNAIPNVNSGTNFTGTWTITDLTTSGAPYTNPAWNNCGPCTFPGYTFTQGHTYQIVYTVQDRCTTQGSSTHTVTCVAGIAQQDGVTRRTTLSNNIIHPNPTNGMFTVDLKEMSASGISVYNTQGRLIRSVAIAKNTSTSSFDLSDQPNGMYLIELHTENGFITHKLIKE